MKRWVFILAQIILLETQFREVRCKNIRMELDCILEQTGVQGNRFGKMHHIEYRRCERALAVSSNSQHSSVPASNCPI